ncbi:hypothetical protein H0H92_006608 [Tricholoma furcatifolium]|nr:hypothetical protein H0H92_006608 [Tricholoma furcatifolium]
MASTLSRFTQAAAALGGPSVNINEIEWATHIPAGASLLQWLVDQCVGPEGEEIGDEISAEMDAALRAIALEKEETQILNNNSVKDQLDATNHDTIHAPTTYETPSELRNKSTYIDKETALLEAENVALERRVKQTKRATQNAQRTITSLQATIEHQDAVINSAQERLSELSILADTTLASGAHAASSLLDALAVPQKDKTTPEKGEPSTLHPILQSATRTLQDLASHRTSLVENHVSLLSQIPQPPSKELLKGSAQLIQTLNSLTRDKKLEESVYACELQRLYDALDNKDELDDNVALEEDDDKEYPFDAKVLIENAWARDQASRLDAEHSILNHTIDQYKTTLLPALNSLHAQLSSRDQAMRSAEALVGAFGIEVEELLSPDDECIVASESGLAAKSDMEDQDFEQRLRLLLLNYDGQTIVDRRAILEKLGHLRAALSEHDGFKDACDEVQFIKEKISLMNDAHRDFLNALYGSDGVQMNTTPPFRTASAVTDLEQRAQEATAKLEKAVHLGEDLSTLLGSKKSRRNLDEFIRRSSRATSS